MTSNITITLIYLVCQGVAFLFLLRFYMRLCAVGGSATFAREIARLTNGVTRIVGIFFPAPKRFDFPALLIAFLVILSQTVVIFYLQSSLVPLLLISFLSLIKLSKLLLDIIFFVILIRVILSWVSPSGGNQLSAQLIEPMSDWFLEPIKRFIPNVGMLDLSPLVAMLALYAIEHVILNRLVQML